MKVVNLCKVVSFAKQVMQSVYLLLLDVYEVQN